MEKDQFIVIRGLELYGRSGNLIASLNNELPSEAQSYARLFEASPEMMELLEEILIKHVKEFEQQMQSSRESVPFTGVARAGPDKLYVTLPEWVQAGLALIAKVKGTT